MVPPVRLFLFTMLTRLIASHRSWITKLMSSSKVHFLPFFLNFTFSQMELHSLKNANNYFNANIYSFLETSGGQSSNPYSNVVPFLNTRVD